MGTKEQLVIKEMSIPKLVEGVGAHMEASRAALPDIGAQKRHIDRAVALRREIGGRPFAERVAYLRQIGTQR